MEAGRAGTAVEDPASGGCQPAESCRPSRQTTDRRVPWTYYPSNRVSPALHDFQLIEEVGNLERSRVRPVGAVNRIPFDVRPELFADRTGVRLPRIGRSHHFSKFFDGVIGFKNHRDNGSFGHEFDQAAEERP